MLDSGEVGSGEPGGRQLWFTMPYAHRHGVIHRDIKPENILLLARVYLLGGERDKALDELEPLLRVPYYLSPGWLRVDPTFASLRGNPRFDRLAASEPQ